MGFDFNTLYTRCSFCEALVFSSSIKSINQDCACKGCFSIHKGGFKLNKLTRKIARSIPDPPEVKSLQGQDFDFAGRNIRVESAKVLGYSTYQYNSGLIEPENDGDDQ